MTITISEYFDAFNNGFIYAGYAADGTYWVRATNGTWAQIDPPMTGMDVQADFDTYLANNQPADPSDVITSNQSMQVNAPAKVVPAPEPAPADPAPDVPQDPPQDAPQDG